jgi:hypothetical protein
LLIDLAPHGFGKGLLSFCISSQFSVFGLFLQQLPSRFGSFDHFDIVKVGISIGKKVSDIARLVAWWIVWCADEWQRW